MALRTKRPIPDAILNAPEVRRDLNLYWTGFWQLCSSRLYDRGKIPWLAVHEWAMVHCLERDEYEDLHAAVRALDNAFLKIVGKMKPTSEQPPKDKPNVRREPKHI